MKNIIIASLEHPNHLTKEEKGYKTKNYCKMCLGHEIHLTRFLIIDMLLQKKISSDDIIITLKDRKFLYSKIFKNCISEEEIGNIDKNEYNIINFTPVTGTDIPVQEWSILQYYNHQTLKNFNTPEFQLLLNNIHFCETGYNNEKKYIVVHHRYNCDINILIKIIDKINNIIDVNIVIFNNNKLYLIEEFKNYSNLIFVDNLNLYASYLNSNKCKLFLSEWSGGGQLSQYCFDGNIIYYFDNYEDNGYVGKENDFTKKSMETDMYQHFDFKHSRNNFVKLFLKIDELLENINGYIL
jgi:hypothetical protein